MENIVPKADDGRLRILYLYQMLMKDSDENHMLSTPEILRRMEEEHGILMHRTTLPKDVELLREVGVDVRSERRRALHYYIPEGPFSVPELRLLIDAVLSSKFITDRKSKVLIEKLIGLTNTPNSDKLHRTIHTTGKAKSENEKGYAIVDAINEAIHEKHKILFYYFDYDNRKKHVLKNDGMPYTVSPYDLIYDGDYYYMTGFCDERDEVRTFRVDRIEKQPDLLAEAAVKRPKDYRIQRYSQEVTRMFSTEETVEVTLLCDAELMKAVIDHFGPNVRTKPVGDNRFRAAVKVCPSPTFYRWVFGWGWRIKIEGPSEIQTAYKNLLLKELKQY